MTIKKSAFLTFFLYTSVLLSPIFSELLTLSKEQTIYMTTFTHIAGALLLLLIAYRTKEKNPVEQGKHSSLYTIISTGLCGVLIVLVAQMGASMIDIYIFKNNIVSSNTAYLTEIAANYPFFIWVISLAGPIMEELFFRKALIGFLSEYLGVWISAMISSGLFSLAHGDKRYLTYFLIGFIFFMLYKKTGNIFTSIITHCSMNLLVIILQFL